VVGLIKAFHRHGVPASKLNGIVNERKNRFMLPPWETMKAKYIERVV